MTSTLTNLSFNNGLYSVPSGASGTLTINQPTTSSFYVQYNAWIASNLNHDYALSVRDATSNISVALSGSNLVISNQSSNLFSTSIASYIALSNFNTLSLNRYDNSLIVGLNTSNIVRITSSNELPISYNNSSIRITASNAGQFKDIAYSAIATVESPMQFNKSVKFASSVTASNISSCNLSVMSSNISTTSNTATSASNVAYWSSNNLLNKNTSGILNGFLDVRSNELRVYPGTDPNVGIRVIGNGTDGNTPTSYNGGLASWFGIGFKCQLDGITRFLHDTRTGNTYIEGNVGIGKSNPSFKLDVNGTINATNYTGATISALSNLAMFSSNTATWSSNASLFASNQCILNNSNINIVSSNLSSLSNATFSNLIATQSNLSTLSNATFISITATQSNLSSLSNAFVTLSNSGTSNTSNISIMQSNIITLSNAIISTNTMITNYSNYESNRVATLSNYAYSIQSSNSVVNNFYTSNITTKNITSSDGGTIGALVMSGAGLALGGYNLLNQNGRLVNSLQDTLGKLNINPNGSVELQSLLGKTGRYTDSVQIGVSTIELSNNTIFFKDGTTSNTTMTSNAITILNNSISTFTISNANIFTNCNVNASNITTLSNQVYATNTTATWASNNNINRITDYIGRLYTNDLLLPNSLNTIGSGWEWSNNGWKASDAFGGYLLRNGQEGGLQFWTGKSNDGLLHHATLTSNGNLGLGTSTPTTRLEVVGTARVTGFSSAIGFTVSNNTSPGIEVNNGSNALNLGVSSIFGGYSADAVPNDAIIRSGNGKLLLQSGSSGSAICITTTNNVGIGTASPSSRLDVNGTINAQNYTGTTITNMSNLAMNSSNVAYWSSNNLLNKAGGTVSGNLGIKTTPAYDLDIAGYNMRLQGGTGTTPTRFYFNSTGLGTTTSIMQFVNSGHYIACTDSNWEAIGKASGGHNIFYTSGGHNFSGNLYLKDNVGIGTSNPSTKLDVNGTINATTYTGTTITNLSNLGVFSSNTAVWGSNTARWSSNYGATLCNLATDALNRGTFGSNAGGWASNNFVSPTLTDLTVTGNATFKAGSTASAGTYTYFPYAGGGFTNNGKNFIRGTTILADTSNAEFVGIGLTNPNSKLHVNGLTQTTELAVGSLGNIISHISAKEATISGSGGASKVVTTFTGTFPQYCAIFPTVELGDASYNDVFACSIQSKSTSQIKVITCRADGGSSWAQSITLKILIVGI